MPEGETTPGGRARTDSKGWTKLREVKEVMHDLRTGTPRRSVDLTVLSGAAKQKMEEKAKVQRAIATLAVRSGKVELACDLLELSLTNEPLPPADEKAVLDVIAEIAAEHGVPTGKNEAVVVWRVRAAQYIVRVAKCAAPWPAVLVELTQPHKLEAAKKTESRPYYQKEDGGSTREERTAQAIAKLVRPFAAETLGEAKTFCKGAPVLAWDAQGSRWLHAKITEVLEQQQAGKNAQGMDANAFFATDADRYVCVTNASKRVLRVTKNRCYHLSDSGIGMVMREAAAKGCFVLIDAIVAAGVCLFDSDENAHTPVLARRKGSRWRPPNLEGDRAGGGPQGRPVRQEHAT